ncbi:hypothetical protein Tco_1377553 [Tanacetum coccineum]
MAAKSRNYMAAFIGGLRQSMKETSTAEPKTSGGSIKHIPEVIEQYTARSGMDSKMAKLVIIHIEGCNRDEKSRYNTRLTHLLPRHIYSPCVVNWDVLNKMGYDGEIDDMLIIRLREAGSDEEIFTYVAWIRAFNINEPIYAELCYERSSSLDLVDVLTVCPCWNLLKGWDYIKRLSLRRKVLMFTFEGGLRSDEHFNAQDYWLSISREEKLSLSRSHTSTIRNLILRVIHKMITYGLCQRMTRHDKVQKNDLWLLSMFDARYQNRKCMVLTEDVVRSLSALIYYRDLDTITLRDLIDSEGKLVPKDP